MTLSCQTGRMTIRMIVPEALKGGVETLAEILDGVTNLTGQTTTMMIALGKEGAHTVAVIEAVGLSMTA